MQETKMEIEFTTQRGRDVYKAMIVEMNRDLGVLKQCFLDGNISTPDAFITLSNRRADWLLTVLEAAQRVDVSERMLASSIAIEAHEASRRTE